MQLTNGDILLGLLAIGISSITGIHWGFTLAIAFVLARVAEVMYESLNK